MALSNRATGWLLCAAFSPALAFGAGKQQEPANTGTETFSGELARTGSYLLAPADRVAADELNRRLRETKALQQTGNGQDKTKVAADRAAALRELLALLERTKDVVRASIEEQKITPPHVGPMRLPGDEGVVLLRIACGEGQWGRFGCMPMLATKPLPPMLGLKP